jgi:hypothetical protein
MGETGACPQNHNNLIWNLHADAHDFDAHQILEEEF